MLDKTMEAVLLMLSEQVGYSFKVVKKQALADSLPQKFAMDVDKLIAVIAFLKENRYLAVKYQDKEEICLALSVKAESYFSEQKHVTAQSHISNGQIWLLFLGVFAASLLGALVANLLEKLW